MKRYGKLVAISSFILALSLWLAACGSSGRGDGTPRTVAIGAAQVSLTDAPASDYSHVYVTVTAVGFHTDAGAGFAGYSSGRRAGWQVARLSTPDTVDLAQLTDGNLHSLLSRVNLPAGSYRQLRIFLASTEAAYVGSIPGLTYNNEVQLNGDGTHYPLRVPSAERSGIKLIPESPVVITNGGSVSLALDFDLGDDVVKVTPNGSTEFLLKPRLGYFDMASVGAVKGAVSFGNLSTSRIEVKAEQVRAGLPYRVVRRVTGVDKADGSFKLYPLPVFGNATTAVYDILIRGRNLQTSVIKGVTVHKGTTPANGIDLGTIPLQQGSEFTAQLSSAMHPSGSWVNFYQTMSGDPVPYLVGYRHLDPYTGLFGSRVPLSSDPLRVASYAPGASLQFAADSGSQGTFTVVADAPWVYNRGAAQTITGTAGQTVSIIVSPTTSPSGMGPMGSITSTFNMSLLGMGTSGGMGGGMMGGPGGSSTPSYPTSGQVFITNGGLVLDSLGTLTGDTSISTAMNSGGGTLYPVLLGSFPCDIPGAIYDLYALGWGNGMFEAGGTMVDLRYGSTSTTIMMR